MNGEIQMKVDRENKRIFFNNHHIAGYEFNRDGDVVFIREDKLLNGYNAILVHIYLHSIKERVKQEHMNWLAEQELLIGE